MFNAICVVQNDAMFHAMHFILVLFTIDRSEVFQKRTMHLGESFSKEVKNKKWDIILLCGWV